MMLDFLNQGWVGSLFGLIGVILGVLGLVAYRISRIGPLPVYQLHSRRLIGKKEQELPPEVDILFNQQPVPRLALSRVVFWNAGNATIPGEHVVKDDPLCLRFGEGEILSARIVKISREIVKFTIQQDSVRPRVELSFDFLDPKDGAVVEILHTSEEPNPTLSGTIRGVPDGISFRGHITTPSYFRSPIRPTLRVIERVTGAILVTSGFLAAALSLLPNELTRFFPDVAVEDKKDWSFQIFQRLALFTLGLLLAIPPLNMLWLRRRRFPKSLQIEE